MSKAKPTVSLEFGENWWPVSLSAECAAAVERFRSHLVATKPTIQQRLAADGARLLALRMRAALDPIIERDSLPHLAHVLNGWGNGKYRSVPILDRLLPFAQQQKNGSHLIRQKNSDGDNHPWQTFAYAVMAGVTGSTPVGRDGLTLNDLADGSHLLEIDSTQTEELGHLLFALAHLDPHERGGLFQLRDGRANARDFFRLAVHSHDTGIFTVCRKFHLTEGIYAAAARIPGLKKQRSLAQYYLSGQLDMLLVLGAVMMLIQEHRRTRSEESAQLLRELRASIVLDQHVENHYYYAGHIFELALFALQFGYTVRAEHFHAMHYIANELNAMLPRVLKMAPFDNSFLHFGHYRRGLTLLAEYARRRPGTRKLTSEMVERYACNFDRIKPPALRKGPPQSSVLEPGVLEVALEPDEHNPTLEEVVRLFNRDAPYKLNAAGKHLHFRRVMPPGWPRGMHYEFLLQGDFLGVEIHLEDDLAADARSVVQGLQPALAEQFPAADVVWDGAWSRDRGRLIVRHDKDFPPKEIAKQMMKLIRCTYPALARHVESRRQVRGSSSGSRLS